MITSEFLFQRMTMELEEMASRPFASAVIEIDKKFDGCVAEKKDNSTDLRKRKRVSCLFIVF